jgi:hypothetical protein
MASTNPGYRITIRADSAISSPPVTQITQTILSMGASVATLDVAESVLDRAVVNDTCDAIDAEQFNINLILPSIFDLNSSQKVAAAVKKNI